MAAEDICAGCGHELANHPPAACIGDGAAPCHCTGFVRAGRVCESRFCSTEAKAGQLHCEDCIMRKHRAAYGDAPPAWAVEMKKEIDALGKRLGVLEGMLVP